MQEYEHALQNSSTKLPQGCSNTSNLLAIKDPEATVPEGCSEVAIMRTPNCLRKLK